jgi:hypothetical protein
MKYNYVKELESLKIEVTDYGFRIVGWKESILPLGRLARKKYKKKLRTKRLLKKYAKLLLEDSISAFVENIKEENAKQKKDSSQS